MVRRGKRWLSVLCLGLLAFTQATLAFSGCAMRRGEMAQAPVSSASQGSCHEAASFTSGGIPMPAGGCLAHCTMDLQAVGQPLDTMQAPAPTLVLYEPRIAPPDTAAARLLTVPAKFIPARILLHSFLI